MNIFDMIQVAVEVANRVDLYFYLKSLEDPKASMAIDKLEDEIMELMEKYRSFAGFSSPEKEYEKILSKIK